MSTPDQGLHVLKAEITKFKNIDYRIVEAQGRSMIIAGKNEKGKSSLIQAISCSFNSVMTPMEPIKEGEEKASVEITIGGELEGEQLKYKISTYFTPGNKKGRLVIHDSEGQPIKGGEKTFLDSLIGDISFDIMKFVDLGVTDNGKRSKSGSKEQVEMIMSLLPQEALEKIAKLGHEKTEKYDLRTDINREIKLYKGQIEASEFSQEDIEKYSKEKSIKEISERKAKAEKFNQAHEKAVEFEENYIENAVDLENEAEEIEREISKLQKSLADKRQEIQNFLNKKVEVSKFLEKNPKPKDIDAIDNEMQTLSDHNTKVAQVKELDAKKATLKEKEDESQKYSDRLTEIESEKKEIFSNADMPVKGLAFDEEGVTYDGLPLCETNIPTSKLIEIGARIGMALNPSLRLLVVKRGESLDNEHMEALLEICSKEGYQLLIEKVDSNKEEVEIEFVEK
jgi:DNA repair exonuclease SbcCD ATPase subunit